MLIDRKNLSTHLGWLAIVAVISVAAIAWYVVAGLAGSRWPGGSSLPGMAFGTLAGLIILFEFLLWPRKWFRVWRVGRAKTWMRAHIWLGLLTVPLIVLHSGFALGGQLSTVLAWLFGIVIASGILGLAIQQVLPRLMLEQVPAESIYSQIDHLAEQFSLDAEDLVLAVCGPPTNGQATLRSRLDKNRASANPYRTVGAVRKVGNVQGKVLETQVAANPVANCEALRGVFYESVAPYLLAGERSGSTLRSAGRTTQFFQVLRTKVDRAAHPAIDSLEGFCAQRRQFDLQSKLHFWMHSWLWVHLPLSFALVLLMFVHAFVALKYW